MGNPAPPGALEGARVDGAISLRHEDGAISWLHPAVPDWAVDLHVVVADAKVQLPFRSFVISVTDRCNIACDFCSHPHMNSAISDDDCVRLVEEACDLDFTEVAATGGEPFLRFSLLLGLATICRSRRRAFSAMTNGSWAHHPERAAHMATQMADAGVYHVTFSWDPSHAAFVTAQTIQNGLDACMGAGLHVELRGNFRDPDDTSGWDELSLERWLPYANFKTTSGPVAATGRARGWIQSERVAGERQQFRCPGHAEFEHVVYARDAMTMPCCSGWVGYDTPPRRGGPVADASGWIQSDRWPQGPRPVGDRVARGYTERPPDLPEHRHRCGGSFASAGHRLPGPQWVGDVASRGTDRSCGR